MDFSVKVWGKYKNTNTGGVWVCDGASVAKRKVDLFKEDDSDYFTSVDYEFFVNNFELIGEYRKPDGLTVDVALFTPGLDKILLIMRANDPFKDHWALPGGFVDYDERLYDAALRELKEETNVGISMLRDAVIHQVMAAHYPGRDPRGWIISVCYAGVVIDTSAVKAQDDAKEHRFFEVESLLALNSDDALAFDHLSMIRTAWSQLKGGR